MILLLIMNPLTVLLVKIFLLLFMGLRCTTPESEITQSNPLCGYAATYHTTRVICFSWFFYFSGLLSFYIYIKFFHSTFTWCMVETINKEARGGLLLPLSFIPALSLPPVVTLPVYWYWPLAYSVDALFWIYNATGPRVSISPSFSKGAHCTPFWKFLALFQLVIDSGDYSLEWHGNFSYSLFWNQL